MKKIGFILSLAVVVGLSSCKMVGDVQVEKRHYGKGYYVHMRDNHSDAVVAENKTAALPLPENNVVANSQKTPVQAVEKTSLPAENKNSILEPRTSAKNTQHHTILSGPINKNVNPVKTRVQKIIATANKSSSEPAGDVSLVVLVILAIILSPLAVYLKEGVTKRFWIDLLCWIFGFGLVFSPFFYGGLLGLFAVVFALLIVLDAI